MVPEEPAHTASPGGNVFVINGVSLKPAGEIDDVEFMTDRPVLQTIGTVKKYSTIGISYKTYWTLYQLGYGR